MITEAVIVALVTGVFTLIGVIISNRKSNAVIEVKIEELTREVRRHNAFAERVPILEEKAKAADRRLTDLEHRQAG